VCQGHAKILGISYQFIEGFASITRLLHNMVKWEYTEKQERAFEELKKRFTQGLVLAVPDLDKK